MNLTKTQLKILIQEQIAEIGLPSLKSFESPFGSKNKKQPAPEAVAVLNMIRDKWPQMDSTEGDKVQALNDIYRALDKALIGSANQEGLLSIKEDVSSEESHHEAYKRVRELIRQESKRLSNDDSYKFLVALRDWFNQNILEEGKQS